WVSSGSHARITKKVSSWCTSSPLLKRLLRRWTSRSWLRRAVRLSLLPNQIQKLKSKKAPCTDDEWEAILEVILLQQESDP
ncbi:hypothetical protein V501_08890, partial [Pseudogymnoascus sp. VKM F-4519 (FW-2642)]